MLGFAARIFCQHGLTRSFPTAFTSIPRSLADVAATNSLGRTLLSYRQFTAAAAEAVAEAPKSPKAPKVKKVISEEKRQKMREKRKQMRLKKRQAKEAQIQKSLANQKNASAATQVEKSEELSEDATPTQSDAPRLTRPNDELYSIAKIIFDQPNQRTFAPKRFIAVCRSVKTNVDIELGLKVVLHEWRARKMRLSERAVTEFVYACCRLGREGFALQHLKPHPNLLYPSTQACNYLLAKCAVKRKARTLKKVLEMMKERNIKRNSQTYFILIKYYVNEKKTPKAVAMAHEAWKAGIRLKPPALLWLIKASFQCRQYATLRKAKSLLDETRKEAKPIPAEVLLYTTIAELLSKKPGKLEAATKTFLSIPDLKTKEVLAKRTRQLLAYCARHPHLRVRSRVPLYKMFTTLQSQGYEVLPNVMSKLKASSDRVLAIVQRRREKQQQKKTAKVKAVEQPAEAKQEEQTNPDKSA